MNLNAYFFGRSRSLYFEIDNKNTGKIENLLKENNIYYEIIGTTQKKFLR